MPYIFYKHLNIGEKFSKNGIEYTKTNHGQAYYIKEGQKVKQNFKKKSLVEITKDRAEKFDKLPSTKKGKKNGN